MKVGTVHAVVKTGKKGTALIRYYDQTNHIAVEFKVDEEAESTKIPRFLPMDIEILGLFSLN